MSNASPAVIITAKVDGFRRCGIAHSKGATEYPAGRFTEAQLQVLQAEPMLVVQIANGEEAQGNQGGQGAANKALNVTQTVELVNAVQTLEELNQFETDGRKGVQDAVTKKRQELAPPAE